MRNKISVCITIALMTLLMCSCCLKHEWSEPTCTEPSICKYCGETQGEALGHTWEDATCERPKTCSVCEATFGEALGHRWIEATCEHPYVCEVCGKKEGECEPHDWIEANCVRAKHCRVCGYTEGDRAGHSWARANFDSPRRCTVCGIEEGQALVPVFEKQGLTFGLAKGVEVDYTTIAMDDGRNVTGKAIVKDIRKFNSDSTHSEREGYEWREVTVEFRMPTGCKTLWGYTDVYEGLERYPNGRYITYSDGTTEDIRTTENYTYEWKGDTCVGTGTYAMQVPYNYKGLIFYICSADFEKSGNVDPKTQFMQLD